MKIKVRLKKKHVKKYNITNKKSLKLHENCIKVILTYFIHTDVNECIVDNPCENDAVCINEVGDFRCECTEGFTGKTCSTGTFVNITFSFFKLAQYFTVKNFF